MGPMHDYTRCRMCAIPEINATRIATRIARVIFNPPATIVFWTDGTKTVVKTMEGETFNPYHGFTAALAKKMFGSSTQVNKLVKHYRKESEV